MRKGYIYSLICPISKSHKYIGQTVQKLKYRLNGHKKEIFTYKTNTYKINWLKKLLNLNLLNELQIILIEECDEILLNDREVYWIKYFKNKGYRLTNSTEGGGGTRGYIHTNEAKLKISDISKKGKGRKLSEEGRKNISLSLIGNTRHLNKKHTQETKQKISKKKMGSIPPNRKGINQYDKSGNLIRNWLSTWHAAIELKLSQGNISSAANGFRKYCGGYVWKF